MSYWSPDGVESISRLRVDWSSREATSPPLVSQSGRTAWAWKVSVARRRLRCAARATAGEEAGAVRAWSPGCDARRRTASAAALYCTYALPWHITSRTRGARAARLAPRPRGASRPGGRRAGRRVTVGSLRVYTQALDRVAASACPSTKPLSPPPNLITVAITATRRRRRLRPSCAQGARAPLLALAAPVLLVRARRPCAAPRARGAPGRFGV